MNRIRRSWTTFLASFGLTPVISQVVTPLSSGVPKGDPNHGTLLYPDGTLVHSFFLMGTLVIDRRSPAVRDDAELRALIDREARAAADDMYDIARAVARGEFDVPNLKLVPAETLTLDTKVIGQTRGGREIVTWNDGQSVSIV